MRWRAASPTCPRTQEHLVGCVNRIVTIGHFPVLAHGHALHDQERRDDQARAADRLDVEKSLWHVHLSEIQTVDGVPTYVNPIHAGMKLAPYCRHAAEDPRDPLLDARIRRLGRCTNNTR